MSKPAKAFQMPAEDEEAAPPAPAPKPAEAAPEPVQAAAPAGGGRPQYRAGKRNLSVWLDQKAFNTFKSMVAEEGVTMQDYVIDLLNREFARKGRPQIAK